MIGHHASEGLKGGHPVPAPAVQSRDEPVQFVALRLQLGVRRRPAFLVRATAFTPRRRELLDDAGLLRLRRMHFQAIAAEANVVEAATHDLQRGCLLRNEQNRFAVREAVRNHVGDRLALAGARRAKQHEVLTSLRGHDCCELGGISRQRSEKLGWVDGVVEAGRIDEISRGTCVTVRRRVDEMTHYRIAFQIVRPIDQILPHEIFGEGQRREHDLFGDFPSFDVLHVALHDPPDFGDVNPGRVARQFPVEFGR